MEPLIEIGKFLAAFVVGLSSHAGVCAQPALDVTPPQGSHAPDTEVAVPVQVGLNPPVCTPGG